MAVIYDKSTGKYYGVEAEAKRLKVSTGHLSLVLRGLRQSKSLMKRIQIKVVK